MKEREFKMKEWKCQCCGSMNEVMTEDLDSSADFYCSECHSLHIIEELSNGELYVEMF